MLENHYGNEWLFILTALTGIYSLLQVVCLCGLKRVKLIIWLGENTLPILCFHNVAKQFIKILYQIFRCTYDQDTVCVAFIYCILEIILSIPIVIFYNRVIKNRLK